MTRYLILTDEIINWIARVERFANEVTAYADRPEWRLRFWRRLHSIQVVTKALDASAIGIGAGDDVRRDGGETEDHRRRRVLRTRLQAVRSQLDHISESRVKSVIGKLPPEWSGWTIEEIDSALHRKVTRLIELVDRVSVLVVEKASRGDDSDDQVDQ